MATRPAHLSGFPWVGAVLATALTSATAAALPLEALTCWFGAGTNRAALVVHWRAPENTAPTVPGMCTDRALAWGFRWNGTATAADLWQAVLADDPRLFALLSPDGRVLGVGFDLNHNARFGVRQGTNVLTPADFTHGMATVAEDAAECVASLEPGDLYWGGWTNARWRVWREAGTAGGLEQSPAPTQWQVVSNSLAAQALSDGAWLAFAVDKETTIRTPGIPAPAPRPTQPFARAVVAAQGPFGPSPYDDPVSLLGMPSQRFYDPLGAWSGGTTVRRVKLVEAAHHWAADQTNKLLTTLGSGSFILVEFDPPLTNHPANPYGVDLLVFGNAFYPSSGFVNDATDMNSLVLTGRSFDEPLKVSVSPGYTGRPGENPHEPDTWPWYRFDHGPFADTAFPTHAFEWDRAHGRWTEVPMDFTKPVNPVLADRLEGGGLTAAEAIELYDGSGGGTGFDLAESGFAAVRYVKVEGVSLAFAGGEVDAFAAARPVVLGESLVVAPENLAQGTGTLWFQCPAAPAANVVRLQFTQLDTVARVVARPLAGDYPAGARGELLTGLDIRVFPVNEGGAPAFVVDAVLPLGGSYSGGGNDLEVYERGATAWQRRAFAFDSFANAVRVTGLTTNAALAVVGLIPPRLTPVPDMPGRAFQFVPVADWTHILERSADLVSWHEVGRAIPGDNQPIVLTDPAPPPDHAFYRLQLIRP